MRHHAAARALGTIVLSLSSGVILGSCGRASSDTSGGQAPAPSKKESPKPTWDYPAELRKLLPQGAAIAGFTLDGEPQTVEGSRLLASGWDRAEAFRPYGLRYSMKAAFSPTAKSRPSLCLEVFFLESPIAAFGVFAAERTPQSQFVQVGNQGIIDHEGGRLRFWKGPLYAELSASGDVAPADGLLVLIGKDVAGRIVLSQHVPELMTAIPMRGLIVNSQKYGPSSGFGDRGPKLAVTAEYSISGVSFNIAVASVESPEEARAAFDSLRRSLQASGSLTSVKGQYGEEAMASATLKDRMTLYVRHANFVGLVEGVPGEAFAAEFLSEMVDRMSHAATDAADRRADREAENQAGGTSEGSHPH